MIKKNTLSVFIPIRKGSKRIKDKNTKTLLNFKYGLTEIKIMQLNKFRKIFKKKFKKIKLEFVVSTDCPKVKKFIHKFSWIKLHRRQKSLSSDDSLPHLIRFVPNICESYYILWTHVTSPYFNERDYLDFIGAFLKEKNKKSKSAFSADKIQKFIINSSNKWISHNNKIKNWPRTQDLKPLYIVNSAAFISSRNVYINQKDRLCKKPIPILSRLNSGFDIDDMQDFNYIKKMEFNLKNYKLVNVDAPYPIGYIDNFIGNSECEKLFKEICAFDSYDDLVMNGRMRVNKGSQKFKEYLENSPNLLSLYEKLNNKVLFLEMKNKLDLIVNKQLWKAELKNFNFSQINYGEQKFSLLKYLRKSWLISKFLKKQ